MTSATTDAMATLLDLHRAGQLIGRYAELPSLLADLTEPELANAGRLLARLDPEEIRRAHPGTVTVSAAVTGHGTLAQLTPSITAELARHGLLASTSLCDFDSYVYDLGDPGSDLYATDPDLVLCVLDATVVFDDAPVPWQLAEVERIVAARYELIARLAAVYQATGHGTLVLNTLPLPRRFTAQVIDQRSRARLGALWREFNARLLRLTEDFPSVVVVDLDPIITEGVRCDDARLSVYASCHLSGELLAGYAREVGHLARQLTGRTKKALVVDLDGTLWGGVLGDDGPDAIEVADGYRGPAFQRFQRVVKQLGAQGVLLAAVSKNDLEQVRAVLTDHPAMVLREDDFVRVIANWRPKHDNLSELATTLNLGVDSFVFVDDSPYECGLVRRSLPGVAVLELDTEPARHVETLLRDGWFDVRELTAEDRVRTDRYREELGRKDFLDEFDSLQDYLGELGVMIRMTEAEERDIARISQLTLRTNQFNLTTRRLQPSDVRELIAEPSASVLAIHTSDRFGDNGLVGAIFVRRDGATVHLDNFVLSCRVFARGIEQACVAAVLQQARATGAAQVWATYRTTAKNGKVRDFYPRNGFQLVTEGGGQSTFRHDLIAVPVLPPHVTLMDTLGVATP